MKTILMGVLVLVASPAFAGQSFEISVTAQAKISVNTNDARAAACKDAIVSARAALDAKCGILGGKLIGSRGTQLDYPLDTTLYPNVPTLGGPFCTASLAGSCDL
jgi:hypothetical protein